MRRFLGLAASGAAMSLAASLAAAAEPPAATDVWNALAGGKPTLDARYRFEWVNQDGLPKDAKASTLRTRLGYGTLPYVGVSAFLEFENVTVVGRESYNDTVNRRTAYPVVADPEATEVNQAFLNAQLPFESGARLGRQRIILDNQRFVGPVGFRQNEQTFDAVTLTNGALGDLDLQYSYIWNVNRVFGDDSPVGDSESNTHLIHAAYPTPLGRLSAYSYLIDLDLPQLRAQSNQTYGLRLAGKQPLADGLDGLYAVEYARQLDYGDNPGDFGLNYYLIEPGFSYRDAVVKVGYEVLEGNGRNAVQTPLATLHAFQGFTDEFLTTPANGIEDLYLAASYPVKTPVGAVTLGAAYHEFWAENGNAHYGSEWSALAAYQLNKYVGFSLEFASYDADEFARDTQNLWATMTLKY